MQLPKRKPAKYGEVPSDNAMSRKKYEELEQELEKLKKKRPKAAEEVARLAELGDFSENVEYQLAKRRLRGINYAMLKLEHRLNHADIVKVKNDGIVRLGSVVAIETKKGEKTYTILGESEADPKNGIISHNSPLGAALIGHRAGDEVEVDKVGKCKVVRILI